MRASRLDAGEEAALQNAPFWRERRRFWRRKRRGKWKRKRKKGRKRWKKFSFWQFGARRQSTSTDSGEAVRPCESRQRGVWGEGQMPASPSFIPRATAAAGGLVRGRQKGKGLIKEVGEMTDRTRLRADVVRVGSNSRGRRPACRRRGRPSARRRRGASCARPGGAWSPPPPW